MINVDKIFIIAAQSHVPIFEDAIKERLRELPWKAPIELVYLENTSDDSATPAQNASSIQGSESWRLFSIES
ncbi:MAG: hypothetical protein ABIS36_10100 [Chryseolinea sp.]